MDVSAPRSGLDYYGCSLLGPRHGAAVPALWVTESGRLSAAAAPALSPRSLTSAILETERREPAAAETPREPGAPGDEVSRLYGGDMWGSVRGVKMAVRGKEL